MNLRDKIKELANSKGMSLPNLEAELGFGNGTIVKWDRVTPNVSKLSKVADYFGVTIDYLMAGEDKDKKYYINDETAAIAQEIFENKELRMLFDASRDASPEDLKTVQEMMLALKRKERGDID